MKFFEWSDRFSVGNAEIDGQHQRLVELVNELHDAMRAGKGKTVIASTLDDLLSYTEYHFSAEEDLFDGTGYPRVDLHKQKHAELLQQATELAEKHEKGELMLSIKVLDFLKDWVTVHILQEDMGYRSYIPSA
jgi:hemerythrin